MIHSKYPNLLYFLYYGSAKELHQVDPDTVKPAIRLRVSIYFNLSFVNIKYLFIVATCGQDNLSINSRFTYTMKLVNEINNDHNLE